MKTKCRRAMKAINIASMILDAQIDLQKGVYLAPVVAALKATNSATIPGWCWRWDKPKLDKRRYRRYQRSLKYLSHTVINSSDTSAATEGVVSLKPSDI